MTIKEMLITLAYALWWAAGGWLFGLGISVLFALDAATIIALANVIVGLLLLLPIVANKRRRSLFFEGAQNDEESNLWIGLLWVFPFIALFIGLLWWLVGRFL